MTRLEIARLCLCGGITGSAAFGTVAWIAGAGLELPQKALALNPSEG